MILQETVMEQPHFELMESAGEKNVIGRLKFTAIQCNKVNLNHRIYSNTIVEPAVGVFRKSLSANGKALGCLEHPVSGNVLTTASHLIEDCKYFADSQSVLCLAEILNTQKGRDLKVIIEAGGACGASTRGRGNVKVRGDGIQEVQSDYVLESVDIVSSPSSGLAITKHSLFESFKVADIEQELVERFHEAVKAGIVITWEGFLKRIEEQEDLPTYYTLLEKRLAGVKI